MDADTNGWRLYKWRLAIGFANHVQLDHLDFEICISSRLLSISESQSVRQVSLSLDSNPESAMTVRVGHGPYPQPHLLICDPTQIWIFTPEVWLTSWKLQDDDVSLPADSTRAMKVLWKRSSESTRGDSNEFDTLALPDSMYNELLNILSTNAQRLPASSAAHEDWQMSYLRRY